MQYYFCLTNGGQLDGVTNSTWFCKNILPQNHRKVIIHWRQPFMDEHRLLVPKACQKKMEVSSETCVQPKSLPARPNCDKVGNLPIGATKLLRGVSLQLAAATTGQWTIFCIHLQHRTVPRFCLWDPEWVCSYFKRTPSRDFGLQYSNLKFGFVDLDGDRCGCGVYKTSIVPWSFDRSFPFIRSWHNGDTVQ